METLLLIWVEIGQLFVTLIRKTTFKEPLLLVDAISSIAWSPYDPFLGVPSNFKELLLKVSYEGRISTDFNYVLYYLIIPNFEFSLKMKD